MTRVWMLAANAALGLAAVMAQAQEAAPRSDYLIGPGDTLKIFV